MLYQKSHNANYEAFAATPFAPLRCASAERPGPSLTRSCLVTGHILCDIFWRLSSQALFD